MRCTIDDIEKVERVLKADEIYLNITDDGSVPVEDFTVRPLLKNESNYYLMPNDNFLVCMHPVNFVTYDCHVNVLKEGRNESLMDETKKVLDYIFNKTPCLKMVACIPNIFPNVMRYATDIGMEVEGLSPKSFLKNGVLCDRYYLGLTKERYMRWVKQQ